MIATVAAIGVLILEGCITALFQRISAPAAPLPPTRDVEMSGRDKEVTTAHVHGHGYSQEPSDDPKVEKVRFLTIAQVRARCCMLPTLFCMHFARRGVTVLCLTHTCRLAEHECLMAGGAAGAGGGDCYSLGAPCCRALHVVDCFGILWLCQSGIRALLSSLGPSTMRRQKHIMGSREHCLLNVLTLTCHNTCTVGSVHAHARKRP